MCKPHSGLCSSRMNDAWSWSYSVWVGIWCPYLLTNTVASPIVHGQFYGINLPKQILTTSYQNGKHAHNYSQWLVVLSQAQSTIWLSLNPCTILGARWLILFCYFQIHAAQRWAEKPKRWIYFFSDFFVHLTNRFRISWLPPHIPIILGLTQASAQSCSVATVITDVFRREKKWINVSNKFMRIMKIFTKINDLKNCGVI
jgi:hypothetical protein